MYALAKFSVAVLALTTNAATGRTLRNSNDDRALTTLNSNCMLQDPLNEGVCLYAPKLNSNGCPDTNPIKQGENQCGVPEQSCRTLSTDCRIIDHPEAVMRFVDGHTLVLHGCPTCDESIDPHYTPHPGQENLTSNDRNLKSKNRNCMLEDSKGECLYAPKLNSNGCPETNPIKQGKNECGVRMQSCTKLSTDCQIIDHPKSEMQFVDGHTLVLHGCPTCQDSINPHDDPHPGRHLKSRDKASDSSNPCPGCTPDHFAEHKCGPAKCEELPEDCIESKRRPRVKGIKYGNSDTVVSLYTCPTCTKHRDGRRLNRINCLLKDTDGNCLYSVDLNEDDCPTSHPIKVNKNICTQAVCPSIDGVCLDIFIPSIPMVFVDQDIANKTIEACPMCRHD